MAWIEAHQQLERHPKTHALMGEMGWDLDTTVGKLMRFWWWCLDFAPNGDLRKYNDAQLGGSVGLSPAESSKFVRVMVESCWIDRGNGVFRVHDWTQYAGRYLQESKFKRMPGKWKETVEMYEIQCPRTVRGLSEDCPSYQPTNQPTHQPTEPDRPQASDSENSVDEIWRSHDWGGMTQEQAFGQLEHLFPGIDVIGEYHAFKSRLAKEGRKPSWKPFIGWLRKATPVVKLSKPKRSAAIIEEAEPVSEEEQLRLAEELRRAREAANL